MLLEIGILLICTGFYMKLMQQPLWISITLIVVGVLLVSIYKRYLLWKLKNQADAIEVAGKYIEKLDPMLKNMAKDMDILLEINNIKKGE